MDCKIDTVFRQRFLNLFRKHSLGANLGESDVGDFVAGSLNDFYCDVVPTRLE